MPAIVGGGHGFWQAICVQLATPSMPQVHVLHPSPAGYDSPGVHEPQTPSKKPLHDQVVPCSLQTHEKHPFEVISPGVQFPVQSMSGHAHCPASSHAQRKHPPSPSFVSPGSHSGSTQAPSSQAQVSPSQTHSVQPSSRVAISIGVSHAPPSTGSIEPISEAEHPRTNPTAEKYLTTCRMLPSSGSLAPALAGARP
jgi:hypothetical protein